MYSLDFLSASCIGFVITLSKYLRSLTISESPAIGNLGPSKSYSNNPLEEHSEAAPQLGR